MTRRVTILGVTGSIGRQTLDLVARNPEAYQVVAVTAHRDVAGLAFAARQVQAQHAVIADEALYPELQEALAGSGISAAAGAEALCDAARMPTDWVMAALVGAAGIAPTLAAIQPGVTLALANKEVMVCAGPVVLARAAAQGVTILPVDSEHNAMFQVLEPHNRTRISRLILTASGGPFRNLSREDLQQVTIEQALRHPNWAMGQKISIDSATMVNKALELIEAHYLFAMPPEQIEVLLHPQSIVHSLVEYQDGSQLAQLGCADMRVPIAHTLAWPSRMATPVERLDLARIGRLEFSQLDAQRFPAVAIARQALASGLAATILFNAVNEVAVAAFLAREIPFVAIDETIADAMQGVDMPSVATLGDILAWDMDARRLAKDRLFAYIGKTRTTRGKIA